MKILGSILYSLSSNSNTNPNPYYVDVFEKNSKFIPNKKNNEL